MVTGNASGFGFDILRTVSTCRSSLVNFTLPKKTHGVHVHPQQNHDEAAELVTPTAHMFSLVMRRAGWSSRKNISVNTGVEGGACVSEIPLSPDEMAQSITSEDMFLMCGEKLHGRMNRRGEVQEILRQYQEQQKPDRA